MGKPPRSYVALLVARWACRESEGGCGAAPGERCKTWADHRPTSPHADRWRQQETHDWQEAMRRKREGEVTPPDLNPAERQAWEVAVSRGLSITPGDVRAMLAAAVAHVDQVNQAIWGRT